MPEIDKHSETWLAVLDWAKQRRLECVASLVMGGHTLGHDDKLRGEIRTLDALIELADDSQTPPIQSFTY